MMKVESCVVDGGGLHEEADCDLKRWQRDGGQESYVLTIIQPATTDALGGEAPLII